MIGRNGYAAVNRVDENAAMQKSACAGKPVHPSVVTQPVSMGCILDVSSLNLAVSQGTASFLAGATGPPACVGNACPNRLEVQT